LQRLRTRSRPGVTPYSRSKSVSNMALRSRSSTSSHSSIWLAARGWMIRRRPKRG
jgi:hypothetical protein